jgi:hypothetical protein
MSEANSENFSDKSQQNLATPVVGVDSEGHNKLWDRFFVTGNSTET